MAKGSIEPAGSEEALRGNAAAPRNPRGWFALRPGRRPGPAPAVFAPQSVAAQPSHVLDRRRGRVALAGGSRRRLGPRRRDHDRGLAAFLFSSRPWAAWWSWRGGRRRSRTRSCTSWRSPPSAGCRWRRRSPRSPITTGAGTTVESCTSLRRLNWGDPLPDVLEGARGLVTRDATLLAWVGEAAGVLPRAPADRRRVALEPASDLDRHRHPAGIHPLRHAGHAEHERIHALLHRAQVRVDLQRFRLAAAQDHDHGDRSGPLPDRRSASRWS